MEHVTLRIPATPELLELIERLVAKGEAEVILTPVERWLTEACRPSKTARITAESAYKHYRLWCLANGVDEESREITVRAFRAAIRGSGMRGVDATTHNRSMLRGKKVAMISGLSLGRIS